jgi:alkylation response protein AidB-like acyl-CoA dehydrogenase
MRCSSCTLPLRATLAASRNKMEGNSQICRAAVDLVFARTSGKAGDHTGISCFFVPVDAPGFNILYNHWTFNMPSDHAEVGLAAQELL